MNRLKIRILNNPAGTFTEHVTVSTAMDFINRNALRLHDFSLIATKDRNIKFFERMDGRTISKELNEFAYRS